MAAVAHDIYGIGATIYCLLVGHPPRMDSGGFFVGRKNAPEDLGTTLRKLRGRVPPAEWIQMVERCIALNPAKRPASVGEIMDALGLGDASSEWSEVKPPLSRAAFWQKVRRWAGFC